ncbi:class I SAM-dependent methyltransferase [Streptomyces carminius]|uniref:Class I SAM-dependent methyltransferase n=1 Tax=Streptomyces carminius TaxID=2665496 RepID=A0A2M8LU23_9ACTN|nr:class I SAM-dependent methyltransferase [Streptomyces carminius]
MARETGSLPPGRALDLAAGEGRNSVWLAARGWRVTAVDFSAVALERGRRLAARQPSGTADRVTWVAADLTGYRPEPGAYDLLLVVYLHLPAGQRRTVLRRAARAVAAGGTLLVVGHDSVNLTEGIGGPRDPGVLFTPGDVLADTVGEAVGQESVPDLETVRAERVRRPVTGPDGEPAEAVDALVRLRRPPAR